MGKISVDENIQEKMRDAFFAFFDDLVNKSCNLAVVGEELHERREGMLRLCKTQFFRGDGAERGINNIHLQSRTQRVYIRRVGSLVVVIIIYAVYTLLPARLKSFRCLFLRFIEKSNFTLVVMHMLRRLMLLLMHYRLHIFRQAQEKEEEKFHIDIIIATICLPAFSPPSQSRLDLDSE